MYLRKISVVGLSYVDFPVAFGKHRPVIGFEINESRLQDLTTYYTTHVGKHV